MGREGWCGGELRHAVCYTGHAHCDRKHVPAMYGLPAPNIKQRRESWRGEEILTGSDHITTHYIHSESDTQQAVSRRALWHHRYSLTLQVQVK